MIRNRKIRAVVFAVLALFMCANGAQAKKGDLPTEQRVYLQFWSVAPDGETKR